MVIETEKETDAMKKTLYLLALLASAFSLNAIAQEGADMSQTIHRAGSIPSANGPAEYFTGKVRVDPLFPASDATPVSGAYVHFEAGARSAWHTHPAGQHLIVTAGVGWTQTWGGMIAELHPGDVVWCPPGVKHWHGASPGSAMTHIALTGTLEGKNVEWMEKVSDEQYRQPQNNEPDAGLTIDEIREIFVGKEKPEMEKQTAGRDRLGSFAPKFAELNDDILFGEIWSREQEFSAKNRSMITVTALISGGNFEQLAHHLKRAKENGITKPEIAEIITHLAFYTGWPKAWSAFNIAREIYNDENDSPAKAETASANYVRLAKILVDSRQLENYIAALKEEIETSLRVEPGVLELYAVADRNNPARVTIMEIYASEDAYRAHVETPHFLKYKRAVNDMVKSLELADAVPLVPGAKTKAPR